MAKVLVSGHLKKIWQWMRKRLWPRLRDAWFALTLALMILVTLTMFSLLTTKLALEYGTTDTVSYLLLSPLSHGVIWILGQEELSPVVVAEALDHFIVLASILLAVAPALAYRRIKTTLEGKQGLKSTKIWMLGDDDLRIMAAHYRGAEAVVVTSGDFSWLGTNLDLRKEIERLVEERAITLITWKGSDEVKNHSTDDLFKKIESCIVDDVAKQGVKCSFIKYRGGERRLLYLYDTSSEADMEQRDYFVGAIVEQQDTRYLLRSLETLCSPSRNVPRARRKNV